MGNKKAIFFRCSIIVYSLLVIACNQTPRFQVAKAKKAEPVKIKPAIKVIVDSIAKYNQLNSAHVGYAGVRTVQWDRFEKLSKFATLPELKELTRHKNAVVRCYAFDILTAKKDTACFTIALGHLRDTAKVSLLIGCLGFTETVGDYFLSTIKRSDSSYTGYKLSATQLAAVDSVLLYDKSVTLRAKYKLIYDLKPLDKYYSRIRELVTTEKVPDAIWPLSKYKRPDDLSIIAKAFDNKLTEDYALRAVTQMPDNNFYPKLVLVFEREWKKELYDYSKWELLYQALVQYPSNPQTLGFFKRTIQSKDEFRRQTLSADLLIAITRYPNPLLESLKKQIKLDSFTLEQVKEKLSEVN